MLNHNVFVWARKRPKARTWTPMQVNSILYNFGYLAAKYIDKNGVMQTRILYLKDENKLWFTKEPKS